MMPVVEVISMKIHRVVITIVESLSDELPRNADAFVGKIPPWLKSVDSSTSHSSPKPTTNPS